jgi:hypothetical protein
MHPVHPLARKNKQENREKMEDFTFSADDEPSWRGGLSRVPAADGLSRSCLDLMS